MNRLLPERIGFGAESSGAYDLTLFVAVSEHDSPVIAESDERIKGEEDMLMAVLAAALAEEFPLLLPVVQVSDNAKDAPVDGGLHRAVAHHDAVRGDLALMAVPDSAPEE